MCQREATGVLPLGYECVGETEVCEHCRDLRHLVVLLEHRPEGGVNSLEELS